MIEIFDNYNHVIETKLDIGVHSLIDIEQEICCFNIKTIDDNVQLLINPIEQIFSEKLKSLLKFGFSSTRYKDVFDMYYLIKYQEINKDKLICYIEKIIFNDNEMRENTVEEIVIRLSRTLYNPKYIENLKNVKNNWLELPVDKVLEEVLCFFKNLATVDV